MLKKSSSFLKVQAQAQVKAEETKV